MYQNQQILSAYFSKLCCGMLQFHIYFKSCINATNQMKKPTWQMYCLHHILCNVDTINSVLQWKAFWIISL